MPAIAQCCQRCGYQYPAYFGFGKLLCKRCLAELRELLYD